MDTVGVAFFLTLTVVCALGAVCGLGILIYKASEEYLEGHRDWALKSALVGLIMLFVGILGAIACLNLAADTRDDPEPIRIEFPDGRPTE